MHALQIKLRSAGGFSLEREKFNEQEQSGILAQNFSVCGNLQKDFFSDSTIQNADEKFCQVATL